MVPPCVCCAAATCRGRPSTRSAMMLRWISDVPPAMVPAKLCSQCTSQASLSPRPTDGASWRDMSRPVAPSASPTSRARPRRSSLPRSLSTECSGEAIALGELGEAPVAEQLERLGLHVGAGHRGAEGRVVGQAPAAGQRRGGGGDDALEDLLGAGGLVDPQHAPLVRQRPARHRPAVVQLAHEVLGGDLHVGEEDLVEIGVLAVGELGDGPGLDARGLHVDDEHADAGVLGGVGVGAHEAEAVVGVVRARRPHLLAVHDEAVPVQLGPGAQAGQVAAGVGLAHAQAPADLGPQRGQGVARLLLLGAPVEDGRGDDGQALGVAAAGDAEAGELLEVHHLLHRGGVAAAVLGGPARHQPAVVEQLALPGPRPLGDVGRGPHPLGAFGGGREVRLHPGPQLAAKRLGLLVVVQAHGGIVPG